MKKRHLSDRYPRDLDAWAALDTHWREQMRHRRLADLFKRDKNRVDRYSVQAGDLHLDFSKNFVNTTTMKLFSQLARETQVDEMTDAMFGGEHINSTEDRAALHAALRAKRRDGFYDDGNSVTGAVHAELDHIEKFVNAVRAGRVGGKSGYQFSDIVNIGIGGSDLGVVMATKALAHHASGAMTIHCISNVDGTEFTDLRRTLDPATTLFVVCSKTFTTQETMTNAKAARAWIVRALGKNAVGTHFAAVSTNHKAMDAFGIHTDRRFGFWDWVGGRYSIWSAIGLTVALSVGMKHFRALLAGGRKMDQHFLSAPAEKNMPVILAMLGIWYNNFYRAESQAILPYDNRLARFPAYLQQLQMESSGKRRRVDGDRVTVDTGMIIWGEPGSNAQHSFYQLLHQGTRFVPVDFILPVKSSGGSQKHQDLAIANCLAQAEALMDGYSLQQAEIAAGKKAMTGGTASSPRTAIRTAFTEQISTTAHKVHPGNRPSNLLMMKSLTPSALGQLIALYEYKVFVEGIVWGINSFDQFGVELGKRLSRKLEPAIQKPAAYNGKNPSTRMALRRAARWRN